MCFLILVQNFYTLPLPPEEIGALEDVKRSTE